MRGGYGGSWAKSIQSRVLPRMRGGYVRGEYDYTPYQGDLSQVLPRERGGYGADVVDLFAVMVLPRMRGGMWGYGA